MNQADEKLHPERPEPVESGGDPLQVTRYSDFTPVLERLLEGGQAKIGDAFPTGLMVLSQLKKKVFGDKRKPDSDFQAYRRQRSVYHRASNSLLVPVEGNRVSLRKAPEIGWLSELYPDAGDFFLPFPQVQGLNSAWQWYRKGIRFPVLDHRVYPYYGVYFPTRYDHLILFDKWLEKYQGGHSLAMDMGTGCGVLSFQLLRHGFEKVHAGDVQPNAVISTFKDAQRSGVDDRLTVHRSDLFHAWSEVSSPSADLVVFNPPWLPAREEVKGLDQAIYYESTLFDRFFEQARQHLKPGGKVVVLFSNISRKDAGAQSHPLDEELNRYDRFRKIRVLKRKVSRSSRKTRRRENRRNEYVELWELEADG